MTAVRQGARLSSTGIFGLKCLPYMSNPANHACHTSKAPPNMPTIQACRTWRNPAIHVRHIYMTITPSNMTAPSCTPGIQIMFCTPPPCSRLASSSRLDPIPPGPDASKLTLGISLAQQVCLPRNTCLPHMHRSVERVSKVPTNRKSCRLSNRIIWRPDI